MPWPLVLSVGDERGPDLGANMFTMACPIAAEYRDVLVRYQFRIDVRLVEAFLVRLRVEGRLVNNVPPLGIALPDPDDAPFTARAATFPARWAPVTSNRLRRRRG